MVALASRRNKFIAARTRNQWHPPVNQRLSDDTPAYVSPPRRCRPAPRSARWSRLFAVQKTQDGAERRQADPAVSHAGRAEPVYVKLEARGRDVADSLMKARNKEATNSSVAHDGDIPILITYCTPFNRVNETAS